MPTKIEWCDETLNPIRTAVGLAMSRVGRKAAGYMLDGHEHRQFPEVFK